MARQPRHTLTARILARLDALAACTIAPGRIDRPYLTTAHRQALDLIMAWMREAGMTVSMDASGAVTGRVEGSGKGAKTLLLGAHIDTLPDASRFDGALGILLPLEVLAELRRVGPELPYAVEIVAYGNDTGMRFPVKTSGVAAVVSGQWSESALDVRDRNGIRLREALAAFGCDVASSGAASRQPKEMLGYVEIQIDQGATLEMEGVPVGVVTTVHGVSQLQVEFVVKSGSASRQPLPRRDALAAAAEAILAVERIAKATPALAVTLGRIQLVPGVPHVAPVEVSLMMDIRSAVDRTRRRGSLEIDREVRAIARRRQIHVQLEEVLNRPAVECDPRFISTFTQAGDSLGHPTMGLPSRLRHDSLAIAANCAVGILMVRSRGMGGARAEVSVSTEDIEIAARYLMKAMIALSPNGRTLT